MKTLVLVILTLTMVTPGFSTPDSYMVTFDDIPTGQDLSYYYQQYGLNMAQGWEVIDNIASGWEMPQSGTQSVIWNGSPLYGAYFSFGIDGVSEYTVRSVGAYFSTRPGVVLEMSGLCRNSSDVTVTIGNTNGSWSNRYVEISSALGDICSVSIYGISSPDAHRYFSMDNLNIVVPEPSSLLALIGGIAGIGGIAWRRRRR